MGNATLRNFTDAHVRQDKADTNFYKTSFVWQRTPNGVNGARGYFYLPRPFPLGAWVSSAKLRVTTRFADAGSATLTLERTTEQFTMSRVTWNNQPAVTTVKRAQVTKTNFPAKQVWEFDVTEMMREVSDGVPWYGWRLGANTSALVQVYQSARGPEEGTPPWPVLEVEWWDAPRRPTDLSPGGERFVSVEKPRLGFTFQDVSGDTNLAAVDVQVYHGASLPSGTVTPTWVSGAVATSEPELDLSATSYPGLANGATGWWRVRAQDGAGLWSTWPHWQGWNRAAKPTLTLTYPPDGGVVEDSTPTVTWTVSDGAQEKYLLRVLDVDENELWRSGYVTSSSTRAVTIPKGVIRRDDAQYIVSLRVWDTKDREHIPGDFAYVWKRATFTFDRDGSLTPVTGLTGVPTPGEEGLVLSWSRAVDPDGWAIVRDGQVVDRVEVSDVRTIGQNFTYTDYGANPRRSHTWEAVPVINGKVGKGGPSVYARTNPVGVWLVDPDTGMTVCLSETGDDLDWRMGEQSSSHTPLGSRKPVVIVQGMGGYQREGLTGRLLPGFGYTAQQWRQRMLSLKRNPAKELRLIAQDNNIPVNAWDVNISPWPYGPNVSFKVSFSFAQVGEYDYTPVV